MGGVSRRELLVKAAAIAAGGAAIASGIAAVDKQDHGSHINTWAARFGESVRQAHMRAVAERMMEANDERLVLAVMGVTNV